MLFKMYTVSQKTCHSVFSHWRSYGWRQSGFFFDSRCS